jgi:serine/threonine-protein kinase RIO1
VRAPPPGLVIELGPVDQSRVGRHDQTRAPQLARARADRDERGDAYERVLDGLRTVTATGWAHGDLSAGNLLWWEGEVVFVNVCTWLQWHGIDCGPEESFADILVSTFT